MSNIVSSPFETEGEGLSDEVLANAQNIYVRDGDDLIEVVQSNTEEEETTEEDTEEETSEDEPDEEVVEETSTEEGEEEPLSEGGFTEESEKEVESISKTLQDNQTGFMDMVNKTVSDGKITTEEVTKILEEYDSEGGLSEASLKKLEEAGYSRTFVKSYIEGQEALAQKYMNEIFRYAGGEDNFRRVVEHLNTISPDAVDSLVNSISNHDLKGVKGILSMARDSLSKKYGVRQQRTVTTKSAKSSKSTNADGNVFKSESEIIKAVNDPRYSRDASYRQQVEAKLANTYRLTQ